jgi:hypothetical protein
MSRSCSSAVSRQYGFFILAGLALGMLVGFWGWGIEGLVFLSIPAAAFSGGVGAIVAQPRTALRGALLGASPAIVRPEKGSGTDITILIFVISVPDPLYDHFSVFCHTDCW